MVDLRPLLSRNCPTATGATRGTHAFFFNQRDSNTGPRKTSDEQSVWMSQHRNSAKAFLQQPVNIQTIVTFKSNIKQKVKLKCVQS